MIWGPELMQKKNVINLHQLGGNKPVLHYINFTDQQPNSALTLSLPENVSECWHPVLGNSNSLEGCGLLS